MGSALRFARTVFLGAVLLAAAVLLWINLVPLAVPPGVLDARPTATKPGPATPLVPRSLAVPVAGVRADQLVDTFTQARDRGARPHDAIDIVAPRGTAVVAVADGVVAKLFESRAGGITLYQYDPNGRLTYYYAHLDRYADGIAEGQALRRGQLIGYVGSTGNADPAAPHLHFAVLERVSGGSWSEGRALNPYPMLGGRS